jgi:hypothetical protein
VYYTLHMAMGKRVRERQPEMWVATTNFPTAASHPFYTRLNQRLAEHYFDDFVEGRKIENCRKHYQCLLPYPDIKTAASAARLSFTSHPRACAVAMIACNFMNRAFVTIRGKGHMSHIANAILKVSGAARR